MTIILLFIVIFLLVALLKSADLTVWGLKSLVHQNKTKSFIISLILLALATSFPELFVGITSSLNGNSNISLGLILGSNIANLTIIAGLASIISGKVFMHGPFIKKDMGVAMLAGVAPVAFALDGSLTKIDGLILIVLYFFYVLTLSGIRKKILDFHQTEIFVHRFFNGVTHIKVQKFKNVSLLLMGIILMLFISDLIVKTSVMLAQYLNVSSFLIGLIVLAVGTSLPELAFSIKSIKGNEPKMFYGNLLGSVIANSTLIVGLSVFINPVYQISINNYLVSVISFIVIYLLFWLFIRSKMALTRVEGVVLLVAYLFFALAEVL